MHQGALVADRRVRLDMKGHGVMDFPAGVTIDHGTYTFARRLRGEQEDGLWLATTSDGGDAWVTLRSMRAHPQLAPLLDFSAPGIPRPLYLGPPDLHGNRRDHYFCVVDAIPRGESLLSLGRLSVAASVQLGIDLCEVVARWAESSNGMVFAGLHPETIYLDGGELPRYCAAVPRPHFLLGLQPQFYGYPNIVFQPPGYGGSVMEARDAVFTVALLVWWAVCGVQPYYQLGSDYERNELEERRGPFAGPEALEGVLARALRGDWRDRIELARFRDELTVFLDRLSRP